MKYCYSIILTGLLLAACSDGEGLSGSYCDSTGGEQILRYDFQGDGEVRVSGLPTASQTVGMGLMPYEYRSDDNVILLGPEGGQRETVDILENGTLEIGGRRLLIPC